jgi:hypothetical protein
MVLAMNTDRVATKSDTWLSMQCPYNQGSTQKSVSVPFPNKQVTEALKKALEMLSVVTRSSNQGLERSHHSN